jgi:hypothetical protein
MHFCAHLDLDWPETKKKVFFTLFAVSLQFPGVIFSSTMVLGKN